MQPTRLAAPARNWLRQPAMTTTDVQAFGTNEAVLDRTAWYQVGADKNRVAAVANRYGKLYGIYVISLLVDTTGLSIEEVEERILKIVRDKTTNGREHAAGA